MNTASVAGAIVPNEPRDLQKSTTNTNRTTNTNTNTNTDAASHRRSDRRVADCRGY